MCQILPQAGPDPIGDPRLELNNPLSRVLGLLENLIAASQRNGSDEIIPELRRIQDAGADLSALLSEQFVRYSAGAPVQPATGQPLQVAPPAAPATTGCMLIVDDVEANRDILARRLRQFGHTCRTVEDGPSALAALAQEHFDVVLLDIMMPGMDGFEVLARIKDDPNLSHIPVIMVSALQEVENNVRGIELGAADYLTKPINPVLLRARIDSCLRQKRLRDLESAQLQALHQRYEREQNIAAAFQKPLLIEFAEDQFPGISVVPLYESAWREAEVGGDLYDAFALPGGKVALAVADASGKGLAAAVRVMQVKFVLRAFAREYTHEPVMILNRLNAFLCEAKELDGELDEAFVTLVFAILDPASGEMSVLSAGGEPPLIIRSGGSLEPITQNSLPLGITQAAGYSMQTFRLEPQDALLMCTDGITEARRGRELLGYDGMLKLVEAALPLADLQSTANAILDGAKAFGNGSLRDDACLLIARRN